MSERSPPLVLSLARSLGAEIVETHISWILLAGGLAYKLKKPVRLPFVDYSILARRQHFCEEEVRLNRRLAPGLYLGVSCVTGTSDAPTLDGAGPVLDYAVRMKRFPAGALFSEQLQAGTLPAAAVDRFARILADFHAQAEPVAASLDPDGSLPLRRAQAALAGAQPLFDAGQVDALARWLATQWQALRGTWLARLAQGRVRDGHGDLHLANVVLVDGEVAAFDCIEFDPALRAVDPVDDAAFALMDFAARGRADLGWRFFNAWLERAGEYEGVALLRFQLVGRALVRAQVEHLRAAGSDDAQRYARAALDWVRAANPRLFVTTGLPGSGKTFASQALLERCGAVRVRSDVERKRTFGLDALADTRAHGVDAYTQDATRRTYERLLALARPALQAGFPVVLDAAFLRRDERAAARMLARELGVPFTILACEAPLEVLRARLRARKHDASEADEQVLDRLAAAAQPLEAEERREIGGACDGS
ncbi:AAA family ATPase [Ramlibacter ginsenosidimutans]|uniref:AAA family ATPase n=1 Tax=Ramlibacter ginsenosidimutans TaxID=502333 RepID=A0A934WLQ3_9BURK|nr:bifunctional aminoglycoside phosphotransferase/ATP-binding protein [Ramlibacter ginsenosidimutans]MBK6005342.1 AAA family ATPase [Ramlibacter ginsenosidimutans]